MRRARTILLLAPILMAACAGNPDRHTLARLRHVEPEMTEIRIEDGLDKAMLGYREYLEKAPESALTPEAMRRLADLKLEKEYGILAGSGTSELPVPESGVSSAIVERPAPPASRGDAEAIAGVSESESEFEARAAGASEIAPSSVASSLELPDGNPSADVGPLEAIELYDRILASYPNYPHNDRVLYQKARAYDELGRSDEAIAVIEGLVAEYPHSRYIDEVQFRRAEYFFTRRKYYDAELSYAAVTAMGAASQYYELALYKLGWSLYKQELHEEALDNYIELLDYKVSIGYDFDQSDDETDERRIADTYRVISLSFSSLGGNDVVNEYFRQKGSRTYEDRIYSHLGEFYLEKLRYHDAAASYTAFIDLHPFHRSSPHFGMRIVEIYEAGGFPKLVLESKKGFASSYALDSKYWSAFDVDDSPDVLAYLKLNLEDLATHYHAVYQDEEKSDERPESFEQALHWYRAYLTSFSQDVETPSLNHRLADLLLEHEDYADAAREYERTAYDYPVHDQSAEAGYAAIYAHRGNQKVADEAESVAARHAAVTSTLRFVEVFPEHEHAAVVLGAAVDDLYEMNEYLLAIATGQQLIAQYPACDPLIRRSAWAAVAHSFFDTSDYAQAEQAYAQVLEMTREDEETHSAVVDNLAAAIYKQGEAARLAEDYQTAADHFLRITEVTPTSEIRPAAEYDAGAALIQLENWSAAATVLEAFRENHPEHELQHDVTRQIANVYRSDGDLSRAAREYRRVAGEANDAELQAEALLLAGELYQDAEESDEALAVYLDYVSRFPTPLETALETRFKIAEIYRSSGDESAYHVQLRSIVAADRSAGEARTDRIRYLAARSALVMSEDVYRQFDEIDLVQPFEKNLRRKQRSMDATLESFGNLVAYEVAEVTAAATFYIGEVYFNFSLSLLESERPNDLDANEMLDYEMVLEEEAFPFEERAIDVHEKNLELMSAGVYNAWIEKSLFKLADLMPGRYAKFESSSGLIVSLHSYAYELPTSTSIPVDENESDGAEEAEELASPSDITAQVGGEHEDTAQAAVAAR